MAGHLIESELFGHERGAFSGAVERRIGHFEAAHGGTLLLDEVSELPLPLQTRLLRVLQEREVLRVGASRPTAVDVRVIATTNRDLRSMVDAGELRRDLFYRLNVFPLALPPLRERMEDLPELARKIVGRLSAGFGRPSGLTGRALEKLMYHDYPGNVRELQNVLERAIVLSHDGLIEAEAIVFDGGPRGALEPERRLKVVPAVSQVTAERQESRPVALRQLERDTILKTLESCSGNRTHAAERLGISVRTLRYKLAAMRESGVAVPEPSVGV
jgi:two-component system response regulator FlrC